MARKVLVTGASGFVGSALCSFLAARGVDVLGIGRSESPWPSSEIDYVRLDLEKELDDSLALQDVDCIVHLAGQAHGRGGDDRQQLADFRRANVDVSLRLAESAIRAGVRRFIFVSSIGVHGSCSDGQPISEASPIRPCSAYTVSKSEAENELKRLFGAAAGSELTIVRPPLVYGDGAPGNFRSLLKLANSSLPLPFGRCLNRRSLVSLSNLVSFLEVCIEHPEAGDEAFVVSDGSTISTGQIVSALRAGLGVPRRLIPVPAELMAGVLKLLGKETIYIQLYGDLDVDSGKASSLLNWLPDPDTLGQLEEVGKHYADSRV